MTKKSTFWIGLLWLPVSIVFMVWQTTFWSFAFFLVGSLIFFGGEATSHTTYNYRLGGQESHTYTQEDSPFHYGFGITGSILILGWFGWLIVQAFNLYI